MDPLAPYAPWYQSAVRDAMRRWNLPAGILRVPALEGAPPLALVRLAKALLLKDREKVLAHRLELRGRFGAQRALEGLRGLKEVLGTMEGLPSAAYSTHLGRKMTARARRCKHVRADECA